MVLLSLTHLSICFYLVEGEREEAGEGRERGDSKWGQYSEEGGEGQVEEGGITPQPLPESGHGEGVRGAGEGGDGEGESEGEERTSHRQRKEGEEGEGRQVEEGCSAPAGKHSSQGEAATEG